MISLNRCIFSIILVFGSFLNISFSQNAVVGPGFSTGWGGGSCPTGSTDFNHLNSSFGSSFGGILTPNGTGYQYFRFGINWTENSTVTTAQRTITLGSDVSVLSNTQYSLNASCDTSGAIKINVPNTAYKYVFKTQNAGTNPTGNFIIFEVQGDVRTVQSVSQTPLTNAVTSSNDVLVTSTLNQSLNNGQSVFLRYSTNNWSSSSIVPMNCSGLSCTATIPAQPSNTVVRYYILTSGTGANLNHTNADFYTINGNTNSGSNFQYTVQNSGVTVSPSFPTDAVPVTISFDATGTTLAGASKVYLHSGVSSTVSSPTTFNHTIGNWGQDDGVGLMTYTGGNNWTITLSPGLRSFYNVPSEKDIFGLNFLFRSADGSLKEDNNGLNYFNAVNPGNYFTITSPSTNPYFGEVGSSVTLSASSNTAPISWSIDEINPVNNNFIENISSTPSHNLSINNTNQRKFRITAQYSGGVTKTKSTIIQGYNIVTDAPRPSWTKPGINYHAGDATRATLVLHAPVFTRFLRGFGTQTGTNPTTPKNVVYVVGDFNNWTPSESYKLNRDRDGWNGTTDTDGDGDRGDYWWIELSGLIPGQEYVFQYLIDGNLRVADPYSTKISDPDDGQIPSSVYPGLISYRPQAVDRASVLQTNRTTYTWTAAPFTKPTTNHLNIYELHFRDFTEEGTYLAAIQKIDYIKKLGINAIHVMPVSEFEGNSSWGYNPNFYFAADKAYGTENELKQFIDECHKRQIQVFNDVVLNHAFYSNVMAKMYWNDSLNRPANDSPYFNPTHKMVRNTAGHWGADWNHESEHVQRMVDSILGYWLTEFKFDGFRFDFTKGFGQTDPNNFPNGDDWASSTDTVRQGLLKRMVNRMWSVHPGSVAIFEHLANNDEDRVLANHGILMWSGVGHHNDLKNFILGYNGDNTNIYNSGIYNEPGKNFALANWMSYGESHDEERLGYEVMQYFNGTRNTNNMIDRLKIAYGFNLLFPGPRMLWQFGELGYEVSINVNGRTGEKPVRWYYYDEQKRKELYRLISYIFSARNNIGLYSTTPDYGNIGLGAGNITTPRVMRLSSNDNKHCIVLANLDPASAQTAYPTYDVTGTWYKYNGKSSVDGSTFQVSNTGASYLLAPSEFVMLTNFPIEGCSHVLSQNNDGENSLRAAIECADQTDTIFLESVIPSASITLTLPLTIEKNLHIQSRPNAIITIDGNSLTNSALNIANGVSVSLEGVRIKCASNIGQNGRCISNSGNLVLKDVDIIDPVLSSTGSTLQNLGNGTIQVLNTVTVKKQ